MNNFMKQLQNSNPSLDGFIYQSKKSVESKLKIEVDIKPLFPEQIMEFAAYLDEIGFRLYNYWGYYYFHTKNGGLFNWLYYSIPVDFSDEWIICTQGCNYLPLYDNKIEAIAKKYIEIFNRKVLIRK